MDKYKLVSSIILLLKLLTVNKDYIANINMPHCHCGSSRSVDTIKKLGVEVKWNISGRRDPWCLRPCLGTL